MGITYDYSLESPEFVDIKNDLNQYLDGFYLHKRQMPPGAHRKDILQLLKNNDDDLFRVIHEYDMGFALKNGKLRINIAQPTQMQKYIYYISKYILQNAKLKPGYTLQGKLAESASFLMFKNILHYFRIEIPMDFNENSFSHGGDGGYDFTIGKRRFDAKHRDESFGKGLAINNAGEFINAAIMAGYGDVVLVHTTNISSVKTGNAINQEIMNAPLNEALARLSSEINPISIVGWTTINDFHTEMENKQLTMLKFSVCMDEPRDIRDLIFKVVEDQIECESHLFGK